MNESASHLLVTHNPKFDWGMIDFSMEERPGVYCIYDPQSLRPYIGSSINVKSRVKNHLHSLKVGRCHNLKMAEAYALGKYPLKAFAICYTETADGARFMEAHWANLFYPNGILNTKNIWHTALYERDDLESVREAKKLGYKPVLVWGVESLVVHVGNSAWVKPEHLFSKTTAISQGQATWERL